MKTPPAGSSPAPLQRTVLVIGAVLCLFVLVEVNRPRLSPQSALAAFAGLGLLLCFVDSRRAKKEPGRPRRVLDWSLGLLASFVCGYVFVQNEPLFRTWWPSGASLGDRAGAENRLDIAVGVLGLLLVLEAARRTVGWALPVLSVSFVAYALLGPNLPSFMFPHRGYGLGRIVAQSFLSSQGTFGVALQVMFAYVFLFVLFGAVLEATGATSFIVGWASRIFGGSQGGPAKVAVISSGLMGSLSGSAVANTATTGTFTIPLMKRAGFSPSVAAGIEAAASSGGALMPPVMGAGAYMMLEMVQPPVTYAQIVKAAVVPAVLYYLSLFLLVHFLGGRTAHQTAQKELVIPETYERASRWAGAVFFLSLGLLIVTIVSGFTVFRAVSLGLAAALVLSSLHQTTRLNWHRIGRVIVSAARASVPLICAAACVGIVIAIVTLTGIGSRLPGLLLPLASESLLGALGVLMLSSLVLGMGLPSAVCYLLLATLVGPVLGKLGVEPLAAHLFIFYFGMMSMVTPPVALAAYTAASIAGSEILASSMAAFRFALVGFTLPYLFVMRPELLFLGDRGAAAFAVSLLVAMLGIVSLSASLAGYLLSPLRGAQRVLLGAVAMLLLWPVPEASAWIPGWGWTDLASALVVVAVFSLQLRGRRPLGVA